MYVLTIVMDGHGHGAEGPTGGATAVPPLPGGNEARKCEKRQCRQTSARGEVTGLNGLGHLDQTAKQLMRQAGRAGASTGSTEC